MAAHDPVVRSLSARLAALTRHARGGTAEATAAARAAFLVGFETQADPIGELDPTERAVRAERLRKAHFTKLAMKSVQARARRNAPTTGDAA